MVGNLTVFAFSRSFSLLVTDSSVAKLNFLNSIYIFELYMLSNTVTSELDFSCKTLYCWSKSL